MTTADEWGRFSKFVKYVWRGGLYGNFWYMAPDGVSKMTQWMATDALTTPNAGMDAFHQYFGVHPTKQSGSLATRASRLTVAAINCFFADFDAKDEVLPDEYATFLPDDYTGLKSSEQNSATKAAQERAMLLDMPTYKARAKVKIDACPLTPSLRIDTGGGYQCYWLLAETVAIDDANRDYIETLQAKFVCAVGADPGAKDLARVLRIPGSRNMKAYFAPDYPTVAIVEAHTSLRYALADFEELAGVDEVMEAATKAAAPVRDRDDPVIAEWNAAARVEAILTENGYEFQREMKGIKRLRRPGGKSASVIVFTDTNRSYHHSSSDPLYINGHSRDAFDVYTTLEHGGDASAAYVAVKKQLGKWQEHDEVGMDGQAFTTEQEATEKNDTDDEAILLEWPVHDHGNASVVKALYPEAFGFCDGLGWMANAGTHYETENAERMVNRAITKTLIRRRIAAVKAQREDVVKGTSPSASRKNSVKDMFKDLVVVRLGEFDSDPNVLNCANGVVDLRTGQLVAHGPSNKFTYCVPTSYVPGAQSDFWLTFLSESVGDYEEISDWLQMAFGYSTTGQTNEECMFYVEGPTRGGKGTYARAQLSLLGQPLATAVDFNTFTAKRDGNGQNFDLAPLRAARVIVAAESGRYSSLNESVVKNITGNDPIRAAHKHRDFFTYEPQFKIWLSSNYPVKGDVDDDAFWGRIRVIRFPNSHLGHEDKTLKWRMASPENLPGILAWAVEGARRWYASPQGLITPKKVIVATQKARDELDFVQQWFDECAETRIGETIANAALYSSYLHWCEENGHTPKKAAAFGRALVAKGFEACQKKVAGRPVRAYRNLALVE